MKDEIKGNGFVMRPSPEPKKRTSIEYARAWLTGELEKNVLEYGLPALNDVMAVLHAEPQLLNSFVKHDVDVLGQSHFNSTGLAAGRLHPTRL
jgi:hypothetical protein